VAYTHTPSEEQFPPWDAAPLKARTLDYDFPELNVYRIESMKANNNLDEAAVS
jgi:hypothetical protein